MPTREWNLDVWGRSYAWPRDGDEWTEMAEHSGVSYEEWKDSLARRFLIPYLGAGISVLEIGPGHGRWSEIMAPRVKKLVLVDLAPSCIEFCRKRLARFPNVDYLVGDGRGLAGVADASIDFAWSFDVFVHVEEPETRAYARELARVLKPRGMGVIHHAGNPTPEQRARGMRSNVTGGIFSEILRASGIVPVYRVDSWGKCSVKLNGDVLTLFVKP